MRLALLTLLVAQLALTGCETRVRENPFDPLNPDTRGKPHLLRAIARDRIADLRWTDGGLRDITGFVLYRGTDPDSLFEIDRVSDQGQRILRDAGLVNKTTYFYALGFVFGGGDELLTAVEPVTPGPEEPWVLERSNTPLVLLAADGRHAVSRPVEGRDLVDLSVDQAAELAWAVDPAAGLLLGFRSRGLVLQRGGFPYPTRVSADRVTGGVWMVSFDAGLLIRIEASGIRTDVDSTLVGPLDVAASPDGGCWVSESTGLIHRVWADGTSAAVEQLARPSELSVTQLGDVWVADPVADEVVRVSEEGVQARAGGFLGPIGVAAEPDGGCWVADVDRVVKLNRMGEILFEVEGFRSAVSLDVSPLTGECWVADADGDRVVRLSSDGEWITATDELVSPFRLRGYWGRAGSYHASR